MDFGLPDIFGHEGQKLVGLKSSSYQSNLIILVIKTYTKQGVPNNKKTFPKRPSGHIKYPIYPYL